MQVTVRYYGFINSLTGKLSESLAVQEGATVASLIEQLTNRYGHKFRELCFIRPLYSQCAYCNVNLNFKDINDQKVYPKGLATVLKEGDVVSFGVISGAA